MTRYLARFRQLGGAAANDNARHPDRVSPEDPVGRGWAESTIRELTEPGQPVWDPAAFAPAVARAAAALGRVCWAVAPNGASGFPDGVEVSVGDPVATAERAAREIGEGVLERALALALTDLTRVPGAPELLGALRSPVMASLVDGGNFAVRVREAEIAAALRALGGRASVNLLADGSASLIAARPRPGTPGDGGEVAAPSVVRARPRSDLGPFRPRVASLFAGGGGLDLGFHAAGFSTVYANECCGPVADVYDANFSLSVDRRPIEDVPASDLPRHEVMTGGPPCQPFSTRGKREGLKDERGRQIFQFARMVSECRPAAFVMENVAALASQHRAALDKLLGILEAAGYAVRHRVLNAANYGVPQDRKRLFLVGYREDLGLAFDFDAVPEIRPRPTLRNAIGDLEGLAVPCPHRCKRLTGHEYNAKRFIKGYMSSNRVRGWDRQSFTIIAHRYSAPLHPTPRPAWMAGRDGYVLDPKSNMCFRRMSLREIMRLQTFPDDYNPFIGSFTNAHRVIGNAVPPKLAEAIARVVYADLEMALARDRFEAA